MSRIIIPTFRKFNHDNAASSPLRVAEFQSMMPMVMITQLKTWYQMLRRTKVGSPMEISFVGRCNTWRSAISLKKAEPVTIKNKPATYTNLLHPNSGKSNG